MIRNNNGFSLVELLAIVVILGIIMLVAVPSVSKHIEESKKEAYASTVSNLVETVRKRIMAEEYSVDKNGSKKFYFNNIVTENKINKSPYGEFKMNVSYVLVTQTDTGYDYVVQAKDSAGYCINPINVNQLNKSKVTKDCHI